jgi:hypothetical protein
LIAGSKERRSKRRILLEVCKAHRRALRIGRRNTRYVPFGGTLLTPEANISFFSHQELEAKYKKVQSELAELEASLGGL